MGGGMRLVIHDRREARKFSIVCFPTGEARQGWSKLGAGIQAMLDTDSVAEAGFNPQRNQGYDRGDQNRCSFMLKKGDRSGKNTKIYPVLVYLDLSLIVEKLEKKVVEICRPNDLGARATEVSHRLEVDLGQVEQAESNTSSAGPLGFVTKGTEGETYDELFDGELLQLVTQETRKGRRRNSKGQTHRSRSITKGLFPHKQLWRMGFNSNGNKQPQKVDQRREGDRASSFVEISHVNESPPNPEGSYGSSKMVNIQPETSVARDLNIQREDSCGWNWMKGEFYSEIDVQEALES
ncbi:hypothetical protein FRX31_016269 [Thalictrum thalictroides]|uniref:Uncharacterized protein n=1 Tax=Thalictrum thalictroides TaxID=46969 RepID=A0A7J6WAZ6_THATH|nr:hypothetical protein FRX31_016269 [Thalictrum thalictroides]